MSAKNHSVNDPSLTDSLPNNLNSDLVPTGQTKEGACTQPIKAEKKARDIETTTNGL